MYVRANFVQFVFLTAVKLVTVAHVFEKHSEERCLNNRTSAGEKCN